jgi:hypothetical protein
MFVLDILIFKKSMISNIIWREKNKIKKLKFKE